MLGLSTENPEKPNAVLSNVLNTKTDTKNDKFSHLLKSFSFGKGKEVILDLKDIEGTAQLDPKSKAVKGSPATSLQKLFSLGKEDAKDEELIHTDILKGIPPKMLKQGMQHLIGEAKAYLKEQISLTSDIKDLPKTLGGLIKLAQRSGIDVSRINLDTLPKTAFTEELTQALALGKSTSLAQNTLPHSTSELVKPAIPAKSEKATEKPLNALLSKGSEAVAANGLEKTAKTPLFAAQLSALLHGEKIESVIEGKVSTADESAPKLEGLKGTDHTEHVAQSKTEQLSQKVTEAKQLIQHVAQNMKEAVENYKPPFTRIKMQLNPQKFGDMEVTLIQRGNNVHININANTTALTIMMQNSHELKAQLSAQGLGDASMNFTSHQQQHQEQKHRQEHAGLRYQEHQEFDEEFTEIATALEIVVAQYI